MNADQLSLVVAVCAGIVVLVVIASVLLMREARLRDVERRVVQVVRGGTASGAEMGQAGPWALLHALGERVRRGSRFYSPEDLENLRGAILAAGLKPRQMLPVLLGAKLMMMILVPVAAVAMAMLLIEPLHMRLAVIGAGVVLGILGPEWILALLRGPYTESLRRGTPDALDLLVVCSEAGMGLESALERVSGEMSRSNPAIAVALSRLLDDMRVLPDRREAFANFGKGSGVEGLQRLATMLGQSLQYGTPLSQALRAVAGELRRDRMTRLEEKAVKLPAQLIFPMIFFIMPSLYIVLLGTSFLRLYDTLGAFTSTLPGR